MSFFINYTVFHEFSVLLPFYYFFFCLIFKFTDNLQRIYNFEHNFNLNTLISQYLYANTRNKCFICTSSLILPTQFVAISMLTIIFSRFHANKLYGLKIGFLNFKFFIRHTIYCEWRLFCLENIVSSALFWLYFVEKSFSLTQNMRKRNKRLI